VFLFLRSALSAVLAVLLLFPAIVRAEITNDSESEPLRQGRYLKALDQAVNRLAADAEEEGWEDCTTWRQLQQVGALLVRARRAAWAEAPLRWSLWHRQQHHADEPELLADSWLWLSRLAKLEGRKSLSEEYIRYALKISETAALPAYLQADIYQQRGNLLRRRRRYAEAEPWYRRALDLREHDEHADPLDRADNRIWLGHVLVRQQRDEEAAEHFGEAAELLERHAAADHPLWRPVVDFLYPRLVQSDPEAAARALRRWKMACRVWRRDRGFRFGLANGAIPPRAVSALLAREQWNEAWQLLETGLGQGVEECILLAHRAHLSRARRSQAAAIRPWLEVDAPWNAATAETWCQGLRAEVELRRAEAKLLRAHRAELEVDVPRVQRLLADDEALLGFARLPAGGGDSRHGPRALWAYVLRAKGPVRWISIVDGLRQAGPWQEFCTEEESVQQRLLRAGAWPTRLPDDAQLEDGTRRLGEILFPPLQDLLQGVQTLLLTPGGIKIPLEILGDGNGGWLIDRFAVVHAPSAGAVTLLRERERSETNGFRGPALVLGDPHFSPEPAGTTVLAQRASSNEQATGVESDVLSQRVLRRALEEDQGWTGLPELPASRDEASAIAAQWPASTLLMGDAASEEALRKQGAGFSIVHLATHALIDRRVPERSALALAHPAPDPAQVAAPRDGRLSAREIYLDWDLSGALVVLSACQTGFGRGRQGFYLGKGFPQALFRAGADNMLLSLWKVDDTATRMLMQRFYQLLSTGETTPAEALQGACRWLRYYSDARGRHPFAHPIYWGGFQLLGEGSELAHFPTLRR
jgi:CHAT domain-containing protein/tetratricopeptide (TPR) repeat protein